MVWSLPWVSLPPSHSSLMLSMSKPVILLYDYLLSLPLEAEVYWRSSQWTWASCLYYIIRYVSLVMTIPIGLEFFSAQLSQQVRQFLDVSFDVILMNAYRR